MAFTSLRRKISSAIHDVRCAGILETPPLTIHAGGPKILSMVCHRDMILYLVAAKSFYRGLGAGSFVLIDDGTLTESDRATLQLHLGASRIIPIADIATHGCPRGGTWERLVKILELSADDYIIQLDADTIAPGNMDAVRACVEKNIAFTLGTNAGRAITSAAQAAETARTKPGNHVQDIAERVLDKLSGAVTLRYVRGCSGFAGFAKGMFAAEAIADFSRQMESMLGRRWHEWGSEQVASNFAVANSPDAIVLPYPAFSSYQGGSPEQTAEFLHFIGPYRYAGGHYTRLSRAFVHSIHASF